MTAREVIEYDAKAGEFPSADSLNQAIEKGGGLFGAVSLQALRTCKAILSEAGDEMPIEDSPQDFARTIVKYIECAKDSIARGDSDRAARLAFSAGIEWATAMMKWGKEPDWQRGVDTLAAAHKGHETVYGDDEAKKARWQTMVDDLNAELARGTKKSAAYGIVGKKHGTSGRTVQRAIGYLKES